MGAIDDAPMDSFFFRCFANDKGTWTTLFERFHFIHTLGRRENNIIAILSLSVMERKVLCLRDLYDVEEKRELQVRACPLRRAPLAKAFSAEGRG